VPGVLVAKPGDPMGGIGSVQDIIKQAAADRMERQGGAPGANPFSVGGMAIRALPSTPPAFAPGGPLAGVGLQSAPGIGSQLAALGAAPSSLSALASQQQAVSSSAQQLTPQQAALAARLAQP
jgi:hypothetical protein